MGEVYLAEDTRLGRKVALKLLPREFTRDPDRVRRFEQEARAASALNHPNILTIHEIGEVRTAIHFIVTEFIEGETLRAALDARASLRSSEALEVAVQVATALAAAHEAGIVHRDIKPENIMCGATGYVKVLDFGLAKLTRAAAGDSLTTDDADRASGRKPSRAWSWARWPTCRRSRRAGVTVDERTDISASVLCSTK